MEFFKAIAWPLGVFLGLVFVLYSIKWLNEFFLEQRYLKTQIARSGNPQEKRRWERVLRRFYIRKIPVIGFIIYRFM